MRLIIGLAILFAILLIYLYFKYVDSIKASQLAAQQAAAAKAAQDAAAALAAQQAEQAAAQQAALQQQQAVAAQAALIGQSTPPTPSEPTPWLRLVSKTNKNLGAWAGDSRYGTAVTLSAKCAPGTTDPTCLWSINGMALIPQSSPKIGMDAWMGAVYGNYVKLHGTCIPGTVNPECQFYLSQDGRLVSAQDPTLGVNAWNGAADGANLRFHPGCSSGTNNTDCLWDFEPFEDFR